MSVIDVKSRDQETDPLRLNRCIKDPGYSSSDPHKMAPGIFGNVQEGCDVLFGDDQGVPRVHWMSVKKSKNLIIFIDDVTGVLLLDQRTESAFGIRIGWDLRLHFGRTE